MMYKLFFYFIALAVCTIGSLEVSTQDKLDRNRTELLTEIYIHLLTEELRDSEEQFEKDVNNTIQEIRENLIFNEKYKTQREIGDYEDSEQINKLPPYQRSEAKIHEIHTKYENLPDFDKTIESIRNSGKVEEMFFEFDTLIRFRKRFEMNKERQNKRSLNKLKQHLGRSIASYAQEKSKKIQIFENETLPYFAIHKEKILYKRKSALAKLYAYTILFCSSIKRSGYDKIIDIITTNLREHISNGKVEGEFEIFDPYDAERFWTRIHGFPDYSFVKLFLFHFKGYIQTTIYPVELEKNFKFIDLDKKKQFKLMYE